MLLAYEYSNSLRCLTIPLMIEHKTTADDWHNVSATEATQRLEVDPATGLSSEEAASRYLHYGPNRLAEVPPRSRWLLLADQFKGVLILVLIGAAVLAATSVGCSPCNRAERRNHVRFALRPSVP